MICIQESRIRGLACDEICLEIFRSAISSRIKISTPTTCLILNSTRLSQIKGYWLISVNFAILPSVLKLYGIHTPPDYPRLKGNVDITLVKRLSDRTPNIFISTSRVRLPVICRKHSLNDPIEFFPRILRYPRANI